MKAKESVTLSEEDIKEAIVSWLQRKFSKMPYHSDWKITLHCDVDGCGEMSADASRDSALNITKT